MTTYYNVLFLLSIFFLIVYAILWQKRLSHFYTLLFIFVPIALLGFAIIESATNLETAIVGIKLNYIGSAFLGLFVMFSIFDLCEFRIKKSLRLILFLIPLIIVLSSMTIGQSSIFYKSIDLQFIDGKYKVIKTYGFMHTIHYIFLVLYSLITISVLFYNLKKMNSVSYTNLIILIFFEISTTFLFLFGKLKFNFDFTPPAFIFDEIILILILSRLTLYDVVGTVIDTLALNGDTGFISFDKKFHYLGSNAIAKSIFPELKKIRIDANINNNEKIKAELISHIEEFIKDNHKNFFYKEFNEKIYKINIDYLYNSNKKCGFMLYIEDDTQDQKYISLIQNYNSTLESEIKQKTANIIEMHDQFILGLATMVESRDNSTGGHIKRTKVGVELLMNEIMKDNEFGIDEDFCRDIIKAAPMHDLGKIAVDDVILRKPGRFTDEEFAKMKIHAAEGAKIVHEILLNTDDNKFKVIAENVAHYHHEKWNGTGYPEGLKGDAIPLEARIMAIADVYDALVSKRVYKEKMSFEEADKIIRESFGSHFDKKLEKYYIAAREQLEKYYSNF